MPEKATYVPTERLYGMPGAEYLHTDLAAAYESGVEPYFDAVDHPHLIEEWSVCPPIQHFQKPGDLIDSLVEGAADNAGTEDFYEQTAHLAKEPSILAAAQALLDLMASHVTYRVADQLLATHTITWDADGEPLVDGVRMYVPATAQKGSYQPPNDQAPEGT